MTNQQARGRGRPPQGDPRGAIIAAAYQVLAERGREATTIKEVARAAGVAPGLIHYYFASKDELLLAVLKEASARYTREMAALAGSLPRRDLATAALAEPRERVARQPEWYRLRYDLFALGLRDPALREGVAALLASGRHGIARLVHQATGAPAGDPAPGDPAPGDPAPGDPAPGDPAPEALAAVLLACFDGLALQQLADPSFDLPGAYDALYTLLQPLIRGGA